jgi:hypothetical protein
MSATVSPSSNPRTPAGWREFKTLWFSLPAYQGPFVIRAKRLDSPGPILLGGSDGLPATAAPLVVPPGPTLNGGGGWPPPHQARGRKLRAATPGRLTGFAEMIVIHAVWHR